MAFFVAAPMGGGEQQEVYTWFMSIDTDRSGFITADELQAALSSRGHTFDLGTARLLLRAFDRRGDGRIDVNEFGQLHHFIMTAKNAFNMQDAYRTGQLTFEQARAGLAPLGLSAIDDRAFRSVAMRVTASQSGTITYPQFMEIISLIGHIRNVFEYYDTDHDGWLQLRLNDFVAIASMLR